MLTYTFTRREKALLLLLALIVVVIAWYVFVFQNTTNQIERIEGEISEVQSEIVIDQARVTQLDNMQATIEKRKAEGVAPTIMPDYDNMRQLMAELNGIMQAADSYTLTFDELNRENAGRVERGVRIDFGVASYKKAEAIVKALAGGAYPCRIDSVAISDIRSRTVANNKAAVNSLVRSSTHVTFFERVDEDDAQPATLADESSAAATQ